MNGKTPNLLILYREALNVTKTGGICSDNKSNRMRHGRNVTQLKW